jgi:hypothetical protein
MNIYIYIYKLVVVLESFGNPTPILPRMAHVVRCFYSSHKGIHRATPYGRGESAVFLFKWLYVTMAMFTWGAVMVWPMEGFFNPFFTFLFFKFCFLSYSRLGFLFHFYYFMFLSYFSYFINCFYKTCNFCMRNA